VIPRKSDKEGNEMNYGVVACLASGAASFVTGTNYRVDGGSEASV